MPLTPITADSDETRLIDDFGRKERMKKKREREKEKEKEATQIYKYRGRTNKWKLKPIDKSEAIKL